MTTPVHCPPTVAQPHHRQLAWQWWHRRHLLRFAQAKYACRLLAAAVRTLESSSVALEGSADRSDAQIEARRARDHSPWRIPPTVDHVGTVMIVEVNGNDAPRGWPECFSTFTSGPLHDASLLDGQNWDPESDRPGKTLGCRNENSKKCRHARMILQKKINNFSQITLFIKIKSMKLWFIAQFSNVLFPIFAIIN